MVEKPGAPGEKKRKNSGKPTIYDVAQVAGVAASTVSRALNDPGRVSFKTAEKIRLAAEVVGYGSRLETRTGAETQEKKSVRSSHSRGLKNVIGLVAADVSNPFFQQIYRGAEHAAANQNMLVTMVNANEEVMRSKKAAEMMIPFVDGLLLASTRMTSADIHKLARHIPVVVMAQPVAGIPSVMVDNYGGAVKALVHLVEQGCMSVAYIGGPDKSWADATRWRGLMNAVTAFTDFSHHVQAEGASRSRNVGQHVRQMEITKPLGGLPLSVVSPRLAAMAYKNKPKLTQMRVEEPTVTGGQRIFEVWKADPTDAVVCFNDLVAMGFMQQAKKHGMRIPEDVAVVGFDNTEITVLSSPTLTTVAAPLRSVGRVAAANVIALAKGMRAPALAKPRELPTRLIVRGSSLKSSRT